MGDVISFKKAKKNKEVEDELYQRRARIAEARASIEEYWKNIEKEEEEWFRERYSENIPVIDSMPDTAKMQYLAASIMNNDSVTLLGEFL